MNSEIKNQTTEQFARKVAELYKSGDISAAKQELLREVSARNMVYWEVLVLRERIHWLIKKQ